MEFSRTVFIDGDELAYKSTCPKTVWCSGADVYPTRAKAMAHCQIETIRPEICNPHRQTIVNQLRSMIEKITVRCADQFMGDTINYQLVISGGDNFRKDIWSDYKQNREDKPKPLYLARAKDYLVKKFHAQIAVGEEADDLIGILACQEPHSIIASSDKDFLTIPNVWLYNIMHDRFTEINEVEADRNFYMQVMIGDVADNVKGLPKVGPVRARKLLEGINDRQEMLRVVKEEFLRRDLTEGDMEKSAFLVYIRRDVGQLWTLQKAEAGEI